MSADIVRQEEFGKDLGLIHEVVVTGRKVGATKEFWARLAHDSNLFRSVVSQVLGDWLEDILTKEREAQRSFFGQEFDLSPFREILVKYGPEAISRWQELGLEPHSLPLVAMSQDASFPGWKVKPENWYYREVAEGRVLRRQSNGSLSPDKEAFRLPSKTVLIDTRLKPQYEDGKQMFKDDNLLGPIIEGLRKDGKIAEYKYGLQSSRFGVSAKEWEEHLKPALAEFLGVEIAWVSLEPTIVANVTPQLYPHMPRKHDGETNTWVWYEEYFGGASGRLEGGDSDDGGLARVDYSWADDRWKHRAPRPLVVLDP